MFFKKALYLASLMFIAIGVKMDFSDEAALRAHFGTLFPKVYVSQAGTPQSETILYNGNMGVYKYKAYVRGGDLFVSYRRPINK